MVRSVCFLREIPGHVSIYMVYHRLSRQFRIPPLDGLDHRIMFGLQLAFGKRTLPTKGLAPLARDLTSAELIRAANEIEAVTPFERRRLVERAVATIAAQRQLLELRDSVVPLSHGVVSDLDVMKRHAPAGPDLVIGAVLLQCAEEIRRLQILAKESATPSE